MRSPQTLTFKQALIKAGFCHLLLFAIMMIRFSFPSKDTKQLVINPDQTPVQAVVVNENELSAEIQRIENLEKKKRDNELAEERRIKEAEQKRLADIKRQEEQKKQAALAEQQKKIAQEKAEKQRVVDAANAKAKAAADKLAAEKAAKQAAQAKAVADKLAADNAAKQAAQAKAAAEKLAAEKAAQAKALAESNVRSGAQQAEALREIERYKTMVRQQVMRYWIVQNGLAKQDPTKLFVRVAPTGTVLDVKVLESSGNDALDRSAVAAVYKASPLPVPQDPELFRSFRELRLILRPDSILSEG